MSSDKGWKFKKSGTNIIVGDNQNPTNFENGQVIINKKATAKNIDKLIEINKNGKKSNVSKVTSNASDGGILKGKAHSEGGIPGKVDGVRSIETEGDEFVLNKEASEKHWKELSKINQSDGNGVPINPPSNFDDDPEEYKKGGKIEFNANHTPSKYIISFAQKVKDKYPKVWDLGGNIFGNQAFKNLKRVSERGYWLDSEEWMYIKWRSYVARHKQDFRIEGTIAMLKWADKVDKGWAYMKELINEEIKKRYPKKMKEGGSVEFNDGKNTQPRDLTKIANFKNIYKGAEYYSYSDVTIKQEKADRWFELFIINQKERQLTKQEFDEFTNLSNELAWENFKDGGSTESRSCIDFIKNSEAIKNNGHYLEFKNLNIYVGAGDKIVPKIKSLFLITYNSGGQNNLKSIDTINSVELANELAKLLKVEIGIARIMVSEQVIHSKPFKMNLVNSLIGKNIVIADRDTVVCDNVSNKFDNGGSMDDSIKTLSKYALRVEENLKFMNTPRQEWASLPIIGFDEMDMKGKVKKMPIFEFPKNYTSAPTLYPSSKTPPYNCELCGQMNITTVYWLKNDTKKYTLGVGSECVTHFEEGKSGKENERSFKIAKAIMLDNDMFNLKKFIRDNFTRQDRLGYGRTILNWKSISTPSNEAYSKDIYELKTKGELDVLYDEKKLNKFDSKDLIYTSYVYDKIPTFGYEKSIKSGGQSKEKIDKDLLTWYSKNEKLATNIYESLVKLFKAINFDFDETAYEYFKVISTNQSDYSPKMKDGGSVDVPSERFVVKPIVKFGMIFGYVVYDTIEKKNTPFEYSEEEIEKAKTRAELSNALSKNKKSNGGSTDAKDTATIDIPLLIRLLELSREDIKSDAELHMVVERLLDLKNKPVLTMDDYAYIADIEHKHLKPKMDLGGNVNVEKLISQAHTNLTFKRGRKEYAPTTSEIQEEIDRMLMEQQFGSNNI